MAQLAGEGAAGGGYEPRLVASRVDRHPSPFDYEIDGQIVDDSTHL